MAKLTAYTALINADLAGGDLFYVVDISAGQTKKMTVGELDNRYQPKDAELAALAGLTSAADKGIQFTGVGTAGTFDLTTAGKALLDDVDAAAQRTTLGLVIGTNVQAYDAELDAIAALTSAANKGIKFTGSGTAGTYDLTAAALTVLDDASVSAMVDTLGGAAATGTGGLVRASSPTLVTPTIASHVNATHTHQNAAGGGTLAEVALALTDVTTGNVSTTKHGFAPKAPNDATMYLDGTGAYSVPAGSGGDLGALLAVNNLNDVDSAEAALSNLGLGDLKSLALTADASELIAGTVSPLRLSTGGTIDGITVLCSDSIFRLPPSAGRSLKDFLSTVFTTSTAGPEDDLFSYTVPSATLAADGDKLEAEFGGRFAGSATASRRLRVYFAGTLVLDTTALISAGASSWQAWVTVVRTGTSTARVMASAVTPGLTVSTESAETDLTGLDFTATNVFKLTGTAAGTGAASGDVAAKVGSIKWFPAAP